MVVFSGGGTEGLTDLEFYGAHVPNAAAKSEKIEQGDELRDRFLEAFVQRRGCRNSNLPVSLSARDVELATAASVLRAGRSEWPRLEMCDVGLELSRVAKSVTQSKIVNWKSQDRSGAAA